MNIKITADPDSDLHGDIQVFEKCGKPLTTPAGSTEGNFDLPGGLGGAFTGGSISIGPAKDAGAEPYDLRLQLLDQTDALLTETLVHMKPLTTGLRRRGVRAHGTEQQARSHSRHSPTSTPRLPTFRWGPLTSPAGCQASCCPACGYCESSVTLTSYGWRPRLAPPLRPRWGYRTTSH